MLQANVSIINVSSTFFVARILQSTTKTCTIFVFQGRTFKIFAFFIDTMYMYTGSQKTQPKKRQNKASILKEKKNWAKKNIQNQKRRKKVNLRSSTQRSGSFFALYITSGCCIYFCMCPFHLLCIVTYLWMHAYMCTLLPLTRLHDPY